MQSFTIGKLAKSAGIATETVRYYERAGILPKAERTTSGYRVYRADTTKRIRFIKEAQALGFTLAEIAELLGITDDEHADCASVNARAHMKLDEIGSKIKALKKMQSALKVLAERCPADEQPLEHCSIINHLYGTGDA